MEDADFDSKNINNSSQNNEDNGIDIKEEVETSEETAEEIQGVYCSSSSGILLSEDDDDGNDDDGESISRAKASYFHVPYGFQSIGCYKHASKNCEIGGVTFNNRFRQFVILDSRGITSWSYESVYSTVTRHLNYPAYQFNVLRMIVFSRKFNVYFALSKEYALKVFNLNFHEVISVSAEMHSVLCMVFNPGRDELITGGTGGMKFWRFGELTKDKRKSFSNDSRPMANYGLVLRASYPKMGGSWVKHVELDVAMQRLYCLSERNVVAYDMMGNELFQVKNAHRGPVTGCVYSKSCNLLVTTGNDCDVNIWSRSGGLVHTFSSHTKVITKIMIHPESSGVVITSSMDGMIKMFSLDIMEEIYSLPVFHEGINWMDFVSPRILYSCSNRQIEVFALNHVVDFWALSRCCVSSLSLVGSVGKSSRVMAVGSDSSVRLLSRTGKTLSTVLPPPPISPLTQVIDVAYSREFNIMYLLIDNQEIWVYYTRTNPSTRLEAWQLDYVEDIHNTHSTDHSNRSRASTPWTGVHDGQRSPSFKTGGSFAGSPRPTTPWDGGSSLFLDSAANHERVSLTCLGMLYSNIIIETVEGPACPDATHFLLAGTEDGRVLFLHMFCKGMKYSQLKVHKGLILSVEHDQVANTLVTQCRALNGIDVQFWSLPHLALIQRITCQSDITCHVRMEALFLSGHESGCIGIHCIEPNTNDDVLINHEGKRTQSRDHQGPINSIDANESLGIFCSSSTDGFLRLWEKTKTLLREISLDGSLTASCFLNNRGDVLIGFKQHIFFISHTKVLPSKDFQSGSDDGGDETYETESDIYEDPSIRYEGKKILQPDPTNMENYLVPFPNLQLKTSFFMEDRPPPDLQQQDYQENLESISSMSDNLSLAPTDVYYSPYSTPRSMSLSSGPDVGRRDSNADDFKLSNTDIWELPDFGDSPVSSPPRTPPPDPTPPPTPPPGELTDEEEQENKDEQQEPASKDTPSSEECKTSVKVKEKKTVNFPSFKREGGRLSNMRIDSKSLRGSSGPGYAAPVVRQNVPQIPEPKQYKPRRPPRIIKKTKKPKDKTEESQKEQTENPTESNDPNNSTNTDNNSTVKGLDTEGYPPGASGGESLPSNDTKNNENSKQGDLRTQQASFIRKQYSRTDGQNVRGKEQQEQENGVQKDVAHEKGVGVSEGNTLQESAKNDAYQQKNEAENVIHPDEANEGESKQNLDSNSAKNTDNPTEEDAKPSEDDRAIGTDFHDGFGDFDGETVRVVYVDPDTGETMEATFDEVPEGAKIIEIIEDSSQDNGSVASAGFSRQNKRQKSVTFIKQQREDNKMNKPITRQKGPYYGGDFLRPQRGRDPKNRTYVVPSGSTNPDLQEDLLIKGFSRDSNVSPLAIFALARSRKASVAKQARRAKTAHSSRSDYPLYSPDKNIINGRGYTTQRESFNFDVNVQAEEEEEVTRPSSPFLASERPRSSKKPENNVVKWCINALRKSQTQLYMPEKPSRPGSSQSVRKDDATSVKKVGVMEGQTLFINVPKKASRPNSTATYHSTESREEFSMYPYKGLLGDEASKHRLTKQIHNTRAKTAPPGRRRTDSEQMMKLDAQGDMRDSSAELTRMMDVKDGYYTDFYRFESSDERPVSSLDFPTLDVEDYSGNWQEIVLARARLLKHQRLERQKSAKERRETQHNEQKERWKKPHHFDCAKGETDKPEPSVEFITNFESTTQQAKPTPQENTLKQLKEQELSSEQPFRLRIHPRHGSASLTAPARSLVSVISNDHNVEDIARVMPRPKTAASIPNKCSRFVLVSGDPNPKSPKPTKIEQTLMMTRFPKDRVPKKNKHYKQRRRIGETLEI